MSPDQELLNLAGIESESQTLFDELAGLVLLSGNRGRTEVFTEDSRKCSI
jgi:hypothetical protein